MANPSHDRDSVAELLRIGGQMANVMFNLAQRPGDALTDAHMAAIDSLRKQWDAARATAPSRSTAPEVDERAAFEAWIRDDAEEYDFDPESDGFRRMPNGRYYDQRWNNAWSVWQARAFASRPAEVDDEGLPPLPEPHWKRSESFTAEQYRQGQRDAVAADRERREKGSEI